MFVKHSEFGYGEILPTTEVVEEEVVVSVDVMFEHGIERNVSTYDLEDLSEEELQELSRNTLKSYARKAISNRDVHKGASDFHGKKMDYHYGEAEKENSKTIHADEKLTRLYRQGKGGSPAADRARKAYDNAEKEFNKHNNLSDTHSNMKSIHDKEVSKREKGLSMAAKKLKEAFDSIDMTDLSEEDLMELSRNTLKSYAGKAIKNREMHIGARDYNTKKAYDHEEREYEAGMSGDKHAQTRHGRRVDYHLYAQDSHQKEIEKRDKGLKTVAKKLGEESEYSAAERIAREILESRKDPRAEALRKDFESRK